MVYIYLCILKFVSGSIHVRFEFPNMNLFDAGFSIIMAIHLEVGDISLLPILCKSLPDQVPHRAPCLYVVIPCGKWKVEQLQKKKTSTGMLFEVSCLIKTIMYNSFMLTTAKQIAVEPVVCLCGDEASLLLGHC